MRKILIFHKKPLAIFFPIVAPQKQCYNQQM